MARWFSLFVVVMLGSFALAQQQPVDSGKDHAQPRVYVTDSDSWSTGGNAGGADGAFGGSSYGGARPQTAEIIKTFGERCPQVIINNRADASNYVVELDHEGGKSVLAHKDKIAVFVQKTGDSIFSKSTLSVGGAVQDACAAILAHWNAHASELTESSQSAATAPIARAAQTTAVTVDASVPACDIEVDGNFVGSTVSTINLTQGKHEIVVKKAGYQDWVRNMLVGSGAIHLHAEMVSAASAKS